MKRGGKKRAARFGHATAAIGNCPFHKMFSKLRVFAGLPVPKFVKWVNDKPDFRQLDTLLMLRAVQARQCGVCGEKLGDYAWYVGGGQCLENRMFTDPPMHKTCAEESIRLCPFLNGSKPTYRGELPNNGIIDTSAGRPAKMYLMRGWTTAIKFAWVNGAVQAIYAGDRLESVKEF